MNNILIEFEERLELTAAQAAKFLNVPRPTYYQYRRTGVVPGPVERMIELTKYISKRNLDSLIMEYVHDEEL